MDVTGVTALALAERLAVALARHNVPSYVYPLGKWWVAVSVWRGLVAHTNGEIIWWTPPHPSRRGQALLTYALAPDSAAKRISDHYLLVRARHPDPSPYLAEIHGPQQVNVIAGPA
ncbi:hypothetical protein [Microbispora siamensis]|uniref:hypothetical protein n=1 Tax=Microbispora siamensis TaxID=564413 RepID=UPI0019507AD2|nr:hypothetical protein [Microbispora siamensis]